MNNIRIYCGTYKKYNEGSLFGKWLDLSDYSNYQELYKAMYELHSDEEDPEFMIQDFEAHSLFTDLGLLSECHISENIYQVIEAVENSHFDIEVIEAYAECQSFTDVDELLKTLEESYSGSFDSDEDFTQDLLEQTGCVPSNLPNYVHIDWIATARDIMMDYFTSNGHYFRAI